MQDRCGHGSAGFTSTFPIAITTCLNHFGLGSIRLNPIAHDFVFPLGLGYPCRRLHSGSTGHLVDLAPQNTSADPNATGLVCGFS
jgi:hypothetical protein